MAPMDLATTLATLEAEGTEQNRKVYARHGAEAPLYGVSFAVLNKLAKKLRGRHDLALGLWATGNSDARILAAMIDDPEQATSKQLDTWAREARGYGLVDYVAALTARSPHAVELAEKWRTAKQEYVARAGWVTLARLALTDTQLPDAWFEERLAVLESSVHEQPNRTREGMNHALISFGGRSPGLRKAALAASKRIGTIHVDHGETGCKTPPVAPYIEKMWSHATSKGFATPAEQERGRAGKGCAR